jgi:hypothetical protein|tara:strand:+ start:6736 stop:6918 length:183 start_codon:yes stop_codon:yes gene_type:complete
MFRPEEEKSDAVSHSIPNSPLPEKDTDDDEDNPDRGNPCGPVRRGRVLSNYRGATSFDRV